MKRTLYDSAVAHYYDVIGDFAETPDPKLAHVIEYDQEGLVVLANFLGVLAVYRWSRELDQLQHVRFVFQRRKNGEPF